MIWFTILLFIAQSSQAFVFGNDAKESGEGSTCRIIFRDSENKLASICTGTLTGTNKITTAGHCVFEVNQNHWKTTVDCGYEGNVGTQKEELTPGGSQVLTRGPKFKETRKAGSIQIAKSFKITDNGPIGIDVAEIQFSPPITTLKTIKKVDSMSGLDQFFIRLQRVDDSTPFKIRPGVECKVEGYGINPKGKSGVLYSAPFKGAFFGQFSKHTFSGLGKLDLDRVTTQSQADKLNDCFANYAHKDTPGNFIPIAKMLQSLKMTQASTSPGDSGGPIYCKKNATSDWVLLGVLHQGGFTKVPEILNIWAPLVEAPNFVHLSN
jgi:hypothetical protein